MYLNDKLKLFLKGQEIVKSCLKERTGKNLYDFTLVTDEMEEHGVYEEFRDTIMNKLFENRGKII